MLTNHSVKRTAALTVAIALATAAPAGARPIDSYGPASASQTQVSSVPASSTPTIVQAGGGFDWGDAGIGAAGGVALSILGIGSALTISGRRSRQAVRRA